MNFGFSSFSSVPVLTERTEIYRGKGKRRKNEKKKRKKISRRTHSPVEVAVDLRPHADRGRRKEGMEMAAGRGAAAPGGREEGDGGRRPGMAPPHREGLREGGREGDGGGVRREGGKEPGAPRDGREEEPRRHPPISRSPRRPRRCPRTATPPVAEEVEDGAVARAREGRRALPGGNGGRSAARAWASGGRPGRAPGGGSGAGGGAEGGRAVGREAGGQ